MRTDIISVNDKGDGLKEALNKVEGLAKENNLSDKDALHLRLLTEETMCMVSSITKGFYGLFFAENSGKEYRLVLEAKMALNKEGREALESVATPDSLKKIRGISSKLRALYYSALFYGKPIDTLAQNEWSLNRYVESFKDGAEDDEDDELKDDIERSIFVKLSNEVTISVKDELVRMIVYKTFD